MSSKYRQLNIVIIILIALQIISCGREEKRQNIPPKAQDKQIIITTGCRTCHPVTLDTNHAFSCITCHNGNDQTGNKEAAHTGMLTTPAHPNQMMRKCGKCHQKITANTATSSHFTLNKAVNMVRRSFGAKKDISSLLEIPTVKEPLDPLQLADDLLRRRCLRCHMYYPGDPYPATEHGTGCAACHLAYKNGQLVSHKFIQSPSDTQCLTCHYGNFVGADYYGRFEHDFNWEYRTPFSTEDDEFSVRPYGIRYQQLTPDVHQLQGLLCIDCHSGPELMGGSDKKITCKTCHLYKDEGWHPKNLNFTMGKLWLTTAKGKKLPVPQAVDRAHRYTKTANCQVCHAQWSFNDQGIHLLRQDTDDFDEWMALTRQGNFEVEKELEANLFLDDGSGEAKMSDKISGQDKVGIWLKSYELRRWEPVQICRDKDGILQVCRTLLDLHLSYINGDDEIILDNVRPNDNFPQLQPYTPHTTGKAGAFFQQRLQLDQ